MNVLSVIRAARRRPAVSRLPTLETPLQTYQRLRIEVESLQKDIALLDEQEGQRLGVR